MTTNALISKTQINNEIVYLKLQWNQNNIALFNLQLFCSSGTVWSGTFSNDLAQKYIVNLHLSEEVYYENTKKCLTGKGSDEYELYLTSDRDTASFKWKKRAEDLLQEQGSLTLKRDESASSKDTLIDFLVEQNEELRATITNNDHKTSEINTELTKAKKQLEKYGDITIASEKNMYNKFAQVLKSKLDRILFLEAELKKYTELGD